MAADLLATSAERKTRRLVHELSIPLSLVGAVCDELPRLGTSARVRAVHVTVGALSGVVAEALSFSFDVAAAGSAIDSACLEIRKAAGRELELTAVEVIDDDPHC